MENGKEVMDNVHENNRKVYYQQIEAGLGADLKFLAMQHDFRGVELALAWYYAFLLRHPDALESK